VIRFKSKLTKSEKITIHSVILSLQSRSHISPFILLGRPNDSSGGLMFYPWCFFFFFFNAKSPRPLCRSPRNFATDRKLAQFYNASLKRWGSLPPKNGPPRKNGDQKHTKLRSSLYNLGLWSRMSPERLNISKIENIYDLERLFPHSTRKVRWTLVH